MVEEEALSKEELTFVSVSLSQIKNIQGLLCEHQSTIRSAIDRLTNGDTPAASFMLGQLWTYLRDMVTGLDSYVREGEVKVRISKEEVEEER